MPLRPDAERDLPIVKLLPNLLTLTAVCFGMTAIRLAFSGDFEWAVRLIILASLLDGLDGRLARLLRSQSLVGAELDSLADFLNFGVAPAMILFTWSLQDAGGIGWIAVLCFSLCCLLRLARFNVGMRSGEQSATDYFTGVPSPAGALLALLPLMISLAMKEPPLLPAWLTAIWVVGVGLLMISRIKTYSFKNIRVSRGYARYVLLGAVLLAAVLLIYTWATLIVLTLLYIGAILVALTSQRKFTRKD